MPVSGSSTWLENDTRFDVAGVTWEGVDVSPTNGSVYVVHGPLVANITTRVFPLTIRATDLLGLPVAGATATIDLANGTDLVRQTGSNGAVSLPQIPPGPYKVTISSFGLQTAVQGDAATNPVSNLKVQLSTSILGIVGAVAASAVGVTFLLRRLSRRSARNQER